MAATAEYAMTIHKLGNYEEAVRLQRQVLAGRESVLGPSHRLTLETLNALGYDLRSLGRHKEAEEIHRRELTEKQKLFDGMYSWELLFPFLYCLLCIDSCLGSLMSHEAPQTCCNSEDISGLGNTDSDTSTEYPDDVHIQCVPMRSPFSFPVSRP